MKYKRIFILVNLIVLLLLLSSCVSSNKKGKASVTETTTEVDYTVKAYDKGKLLDESTIGAGSTYSNLKSLSNNLNIDLGYEFVGWYDESGSEFKNNDKVKSNLVLKSKYQIKTLDMPIIEINVEEGKDIVSKEEYLNASINLSNAEEKYCFSEVSAKVRGRGNTSWNQDKKSYRIKFDKKQSMFGSKYKAKSWTLIASHSDKTLSRNYIAYELSKSFDGLDFTSTHEFVELFLNGEYKGVYLLCDQIQTGEGRIEVNENSKNIDDLGFLIERDFRASKEGIKNQDYFTFENNPYTIKTPDTSSDEYIQNKDEYINSIKSFLANVYSKIQNNNLAELEEVMDIDSFIDAYIIEELFANDDYGNASTYYYKNKDGKLTAGPIWDFDIGGGNLNYDMGNLINCPADFTLWCANINFWDKALIEHCDGYVSRLKERLKDCHDRITSIIDKLDTNSDSGIYLKYKNSLERNFEKWHIMGKYIWPEPLAVYKLITVKEQFEYLRVWLTTRLTYLENYYSL